MLQRKSQLQTKTTALSTLERSMLIQQRTLALRRQDLTEVEEIDLKLEADKQQQQQTGGMRNDTVDLLARVNERNRKANVEAVRRAELEGAERKRRDRKLAMENGGVGTPIDPSARLKIMPRTFTAANTPTSTRLVVFLLVLFVRFCGG